MIDLCDIKFFEIEKTATPSRFFNEWDFPFEIDSVIELERKEGMLNALTSRRVIQNRFVDSSVRYSTERTSQCSRCGSPILEPSSGGYCLCNSCEKEFDEVNDEF